MHRADFITAFQNSGEVTTDHLTTLAGAVQGGKIEDVAAAALDAALADFSRDCVRVLSKTGTWAAAEVTLDSWHRSSRVLTVECPAGQRPKVYHPLSTVEVDKESGTVYLTAAATGDAYAVRYTAMHVIPAMPTGGASPTDVSIPTELYQVYFTLAASVVFTRLAAHYGGTTGSSFSADAVSYQTKTGEYLRLAKEARTRYRLALGLPETPVLEGASVDVEVVLDDGRIFGSEPWTV